METINDQQPKRRRGFRLLFMVFVSLLFFPPIFIPHFVTDPYILCIVMVTATTCEAFVIWIMVGGFPFSRRESLPLSMTKKMIISMLAIGMLIYTTMLGLYLLDFYEKVVFENDILKRDFRMEETTSSKPTEGANALSLLTVKDNM